MSVAQSDKSLVAGLREALGSRSIVMVGLMGCGKTSVGRRLAHALELKFIDSDEAIEAAAGKSIMEIFADHGEPYFRAGERRVISRLLNAGPQVLATGGGAFMAPDTRARIAESGISVWLKADLALLMKRVMRRANRPLLKTSDPVGRMREMIQARYPTYAQADITIDSREVPHDAMVQEIIRALGSGPLKPDPRSKP